MAETLGEKLRQAREEKGLSLRELADSTRISVRYLESIEADDYKTLPGGVFNKGFVKSYARALGIDEKEALEDYNRLMSQQAGSNAAELDAPISRKREVYIGDEPRSPFLTILIALIMLGLLTWGVIAAVQWYQNRGNQIATNASPTPTPNANQSPTPTPTPVFTGLNIQLRAGDEDISITATEDGKKRDIYLKSGASSDLKAENEIKLVYAKSRARTLQMTINGQPATATTQSAKNAVEMVINRDNYAQFLQGSQANAQSGR